MDYSQFREDLKTQDAVIRNLEILGEAAKQIPDSVTNRYQDLPWKEIRGTRDRLIHHYFGVNLDVIWHIVSAELPEMVVKLQSILSNREEINHE